MQYPGGGVAIIAAANKENLKMQLNICRISSSSRFADLGIIKRNILDPLSKMEAVAGLSRSNPTPLLAAVISN